VRHVRSPLCHAHVRPDEAVQLPLLLSEDEDDPRRSKAGPEIHPFRALTGIFLIVIGTTALFYPLAAVMFTGKVIPEGICVQFTPSIATVILFALADFGLSCLLLLLFVLPLTRFAKRQASVTGKALMWIAYQNLAVSAFVMLFTMSQLTYMTVVDVQTVQQRLEDQLGGPHITSVRRYDIILCAA